MVIQRRYVKIFKIFENDPQGKAILYKAFADAGRTDEDRDFTLNADAGIILNDAQMVSCLPNLQWIDGGKSVVYPEVEDETQVITVFIYRVLGPNLSRSAANSLKVQDEWNHVFLVGQGIHWLVAEYRDEHVVYQVLDVPNVLLRPA